MIIELIVFALTSLFAYYFYGYKKITYYLASKDVKFLPGWPLFGNSLLSGLQRKHMFEDLDSVYRAFPNERYVAYIENTKLIIMIRDPELIRLTTVKDFDHFVDHKLLFDEDLDPLFKESLFVMKGDKWRDMRTTLSPAFTGSKMRHMIHFMTDISHNFVNHLKDRLNEEIDIDDLVRRYTNDVIASTSFGLQVNSLKDRDNEFFKAGQKVFKFNIRQLLILFWSDQFPSLTKKLGLKLQPEKYYDFFRRTVADTINHRKTNNVQRPDMIQLLMETSKEWTPSELAAQAFIFFAAGFDTVASVLILCFHELANHPDIQKRLYQEIRAFQEVNEKLNSENITVLKYLDCVVNETLRRWSPAVMIDRQCVKTYQLPPPRDGGKPYTLYPGDVIYNSCNSLHLDPQYFPDPLTFNPDRFSDENKHNIKPFTYMPFGSGPRICIGVRLAIMEIKVLVYHILTNFRIRKCAKTTDPIELLPSGFSMVAKGGSWVQFENRQ